LELGNQGWGSSIKDLIKASKNHLLLVVRDSLTCQVIQKWNFRPSFVYNIAENDCFTICESIVEQIK
jgi:hypothetical protein